MSLYDFAIEMSRDGEKFFHTLTKQVKKPGLHKILVTLAEDQAAHGRDLEEMKKAKGKTLPDAGVLRRAVNPFAKRLKRLGSGERLDENIPPAELYRKKAAQVKDPQLRQAFLEVADEQRKHYIGLEHLINFILEPHQGLEDAEWNIPEPHV